MRESRTYGSVRGALSNERPYRDGCCLLRLRAGLRTDRLHWMRGITDEGDAPERPCPHRIAVHQWELVNVRCRFISAGMSSHSTLPPPSNADNLSFPIFVRSFRSQGVEHES